MFNLIATMLICLGVANTTPISNYNEKQEKIVLSNPKKSYTTNYTLTLTNSLYGAQNYNTGDYIYYERSFKTTNGNTAINVKMDIYKTLTAYNDYGTTKYAVNTQTNPDNAHSNVSRMGYIFQVTPYNINVETNLNIKILLDIPAQNNNALALIRTLFSSTDNGFASYIDRQMTVKTPYNIYADIKNVNNGYYFNEETEEIVLSTGAGASYVGAKNDEIEITIVPNQTNYFYVDYLPYVNTNLSTIENGKIALLNNFDINQNGATITGTNIIPDSTYEIVDIPGLMFEVIGMPFAFVSQAFNITLFPGTPYQINIANLFLSIIAIFVFVWLIMLFVKKGS